MQGLFPELYNTPESSDTPYQPRAVDNSANYGTNMWSPLNQWFDENKEGYNKKLQNIGGIGGEGFGVLSGLLGGMEDPLSLIGMATNKKADGSNQTNDIVNNNQTNVNADPNLSVSNQVNKPSYSTEGWYGGHAGGGQTIDISSQYNSGPGLFSWQNAKNIFELGTGGFGFGAQNYDDGSVDTKNWIQGGYGS